MVYSRNLRILGFLTASENEMYVGWFTIQGEIELSMSLLVRENNSCAIEQDMCDSGSGHQERSDELILINGDEKSQ